MAQEFDKQGHRGCRGLMPENTIPAMLYAIDLDVTTLEMDVCFTKDMKAILSHEPFFSHDITTTPDGKEITEEEERSHNIYEMTYDEMSRYDVGTKTHPKFPGQQKIKVSKPLLTDVIDAAEKYTKDKGKRPVYYNIETKTNPSTDAVYHPLPDVFVDEVMKVISSKRISQRVIIQSFDIRTLQYLHNKYPQIKTALLIEPAELTSVQQKIDKLGFDPDIISPEYHMVSGHLVETSRSKGMKVIPWTVNDSATISKLIQLGVDGIITDYPDLFEKK